MLSWLKPFLGFLHEVAKYFQTRQLLDAGKAEEVVEELEILEQEKQNAQRAVDVADGVRTERLRKRFDRGE